MLVKLNFNTEKNKIRVLFLRVHIHTYTYVRAYPRPNIRESCEAAKINHGESSVIQFKLINFFFSETKVKIDKCAYIKFDVFHTAK